MGRLHEAELTLPAVLTSIRIPSGRVDGLAGSPERGSWPWGCIPISGSLGQVGQVGQRPVPCDLWAVAFGLRDLGCRFHDPRVKAHFRPAATQRMPHHTRRGSSANPQHPPCRC
jgi:hypothetical protein